MNRRDFFKMSIGGVAAIAAERSFPFRVFSFPAQVVKPQLAATSIRFVRMFDPFESKMINRFDVLYGFGQLELPRGIETAIVRNVTDKHFSAKDIEDFKKECVEKFMLPRAALVFPTAEQVLYRKPDLQEHHSYQVNASIA